MKLRTFLPVLCGVAGLCCSFEFRPESPFSGTYMLSSSCELKVRENGASASCSDITVQVSIDAEKVTFDSVAIVENLPSSDCWTEKKCTSTYTGSMTRKSGSGDLYKGRFGMLAGTWEGTITFKEACTTSAKTGAPDYCSKLTDEKATYTVSATVTAQQGSITWKGDDGSEGSFTALETPGGVRVADTYYPRKQADGTTVDGSVASPDTGGATGDKGSTVWPDGVGTGG